MAPSAAETTKAFIFRFASRIGRYDLNNNAGLIGVSVFGGSGFPAGRHGLESLMGTGILICGLNGAGKSALGRALAKKLNYHFIDIENLYFPKTDPRDLYASPRAREEVVRLLFNEIRAHENFVFASVKGDYGESIEPFFRYAVLIDVSKEIRLRRVRNRSFLKFGNRMLPGGDLHEREEAFFAFVRSRNENAVDEWIKSLSCPIIRVDGTKPVGENIGRIIKRIQD